MPRFIILLLCWLPACWSLAQDDVWLLDTAGQRPALTELDRQYIIARMDQLDLASCQTRLLRQRPRIVYRQLTLPHDGRDLHINSPSHRPTSTPHGSSTPATGSCAQTLLIQPYPSSQLHAASDPLLAGHR